VLFHRLAKLPALLFWGPRQAGFQLPFWGRFLGRARLRAGLHRSDIVAVAAAISEHGIASNNSYNANKIRFPAPVPVDSKVRGRAEVVSIDEKGGGWWEVVTRFTLEVEGNEKPCFVGDSVTWVMAPAADESD
jgi:acyl dehydratase